MNRSTGTYIMNIIWFDAYCIKLKMTYLNSFDLLKEFGRCSTDPACFSEILQIINVFNFECNIQAMMHTMLLSSSSGFSTLSLPLKLIRKKQYFEPCCYSAMTKKDLGG